MKKLILFALVVLAGLASASLAPAQERQLHGQIPFSFVAGTARLSAGEYRIVYDHSGLATFRNVDDGTTAITFAASDQGVRDGSCKLVFARYGELYFLKQSHCDAANANFFVPTSRLEKKAIERATMTREGDQTVIAMK